jgi:hypothetical protein
MNKPLQFSAIFRFSFYAIEPAEACARYGSTMESALSSAAQQDWTLTTLSFSRMTSPPGWTASFSIRKSFATAAWADSPFEAVLGALWIANAHADWIDANPQPSRHASPELLGRVPSPRKAQPEAPVRRTLSGRIMSAEQAKLFDELFSVD